MQVGDKYVHGIFAGVDGDEKDYHNHTAQRIGANLCTFRVSMVLLILPKKEGLII